MNIDSLYWDVGFWRFTFGIRIGEWALPFGFAINVGAYSINFLCFFVDIWRNDMRHYTMD